MTRIRDVRTELIGATTVLMPKPLGISGSRGAMQGAHYPQAPQIVGNEPFATQVGVESDYANYSFGIRVEQDCRIERTINRTAIDGTVLETTVFVSLKDDPNTIDVYIIPKFRSDHQYFGYDLVKTDIGENPHYGRRLNKGDLFADTTGNVDGKYSIGLDVPALLISHPAGIEDSFMVSQSLADKMMSYGYKQYVMTLSQDEYPLYLYGDADNPRIHPNVGEFVRADGILMAKRSHEPYLVGAECSRGSIREVDTNFDEACVCDAGAEVVDIVVYRNSPDTSKLSQFAETKIICDRHADITSMYYHQIRQFYSEIQRNKNLKLTGAAHVLIYQALADDPTNFSPVGIRSKQFGRDKIDEYYIMVTVKFQIPLTASSKITGPFGDKGVVCAVVPDEKMPIDEFGNRVHLIGSDNSTLRRTNFTRLFVHYINAASRDVRKRILEMDPLEGYDYLLGYFACICKEWHDAVASTHETTESRIALIKALATNKIEVVIPHHAPELMDEILERVEASYPPDRSKITFFNNEGDPEESIYEMIVGELPIFRLDKTGRDMSAVSYAKYQMFGTIAKEHSHDQHRKGVRNQPIKHMGESEARFLAAIVGPRLVAENMDRNNNPIVGDEMVLSIITAELPTNITKAIDRTKFPLGNHRSLAIFNHLNSCDGVAFTNKDHL